jgi:sulfhydrogenase subunit beta (sulfur reductase)
MLSLPAEKIDSLFELISSKTPLYIPVDNTSGTADFMQWKHGTKISSTLRTVRSAKDFFFPKTEKLVNFKMEGKKIEVDDPRKELEDFVIFGVRACDAASFSIVDDVYLNMQPVDTYYKNRREHGIVVTLACTEPAQTCFCKLYGIDAAEPAGDVSAWFAKENYFFKPNTEKGKQFVGRIQSLLVETDSKAVEEQQKETRSKVEKLPFVHLDHSKFTGANMNSLFNSKVWENLSSTCLGCGTCTYVCPTCMCFDIRDFDTGHGIIQRFRCWDSCMYSDFTKMAAANPRLTQKERFRQRFMHKLVYYPMDHNNVKSCVGCGRCLESCPIHMNIVKVIKTLNEEPETPDGGKA